MSNQSNGAGKGLILDRERLCKALGVADSTIGSWEAKGLPVVRRGRGRGMRSLYSYDDVVAWCAKTGYGHSIQTLLARFSRTEPAAAPAPSFHTSAQPPAPAPAQPPVTVDPDAASAWRVHPALEMALFSLPAALQRAGLAGEIIDQVLAELWSVMQSEMEGRGEPAQFIEEELSGLRRMVEEERAEPGTWTE